MHVKEYQEVTISFPEESYLLNTFANDKEWMEKSLVTNGATFIKILREDRFTPKKDA